MATLSAGTVCLASPRARYSYETHMPNRSSSFCFLLRPARKAGPFIKILFRLSPSRAHEAIKPFEGTELSAHHSLGVSVVSPFLCLRRPSSNSPGRERPDQSAAASLRSVLSHYSYLYYSGSCPSLSLFRIFGHILPAFCSAV